MGKTVVIYTTVDSEEKGKKLARELVEHHIAACVSIFPGIMSIYPWKGQICEEKEWFLLIKTREDKIMHLRAFFETHHPYTVPEFLVLPVLYTGPSYKEWLDSWLDDEASHQEK